MHARPNGIGDSGTSEGGRLQDAPEKGGGAEVTLQLAREEDPGERGHGEEKERASIPASGEEDEVTNEARSDRRG
jgi:hypothetical protein